jgi:hypothetical protein
MGVAGHQGSERLERPSLPRQVDVRFWHLEDIDFDAQSVRFRG